jgi:serine/threonine protein phosphatase PrpC
MLNATGVLEIQTGRTLKSKIGDRTKRAVTVHFDFADLSLAGHRQKNQDRVHVSSTPDTQLLVVADGMGGHAEGELAAEVTLHTLSELFRQASKPLLDPQGFLTMGLAKAHDAVVALGAQVNVDHRPRATCAVCLVQDGGTYWAHVGDSRIYQIRQGAIRERTRDHSHVELLLREGLIAEKDAKHHPMRNFVECCLGGDMVLPDMSVTARKSLCPGDVLVLCTDGLWTGVEDEEIAAAFAAGERKVADVLRELAERAVSRNAPHSDNTTAAALRWRA